MAYLLNPVLSRKFGESQTAAPKFRKLVFTSNGYLSHTISYTMLHLRPKENNPE
jgi:hypothetical protein